VILRETGQRLGYVRRILSPSSRGANWMVYNADGSELGNADLRGTAANWLKREAEASPAAVTS
jgi:hypothetical protein